jgi:hypothetical protein
VLKVKSFGGEIDRVPTFILYMSPRAIKKLDNAKIHKIVPVHMREWALETFVFLV